jgi:pSer/pThr/pTyr-binding forkhead associated (FHA) protein
MQREEVTVAKRENPLLVEVARVTFNNVTREFDDAVRIGSHPSNEVVIDDPTVSRFHCRLSRESGGRWKLTDLGSKNGTRLNGVRVLVAELERAATLTLGDSTLDVKLGAAASNPQVRRTSFGAIVGESAAMQRLYAILERVAASDIDVLIHGESGTG